MLNIKYLTCIISNRNNKSYPSDSTSKTEVELLSNVTKGHLNRTNIKVTVCEMLWLIQKHHNCSSFSISKTNLSTFVSENHVNTEQLQKPKGQSITDVYCSSHIQVINRSQDMLGDLMQLNSHPRLCNML